MSALPKVEELTFDELRAALPDGVEWFEPLDHAAYHFVRMAYFEGVAYGVQAEKLAHDALATATFRPKPDLALGEVGSVEVIERPEQ